MELDLFEFANSPSNTQKPESGPLAYRMRPQTLDEFIGQDKILGPGKPFRQWIETDRVPSLILWGPPGCGKTTLAKIIAQTTRFYFESISAVVSGIKELKEITIRAKEIRELHHRRTIVFIDEIHRFNRTQQDALLPHVEDGTLVLIGATTENPSFEINSALLSRVRVIRIDRLTQEALETIIKKALIDPIRGLGGFLKLSKEAIQWLAETSEGDARRALTSLESIAFFAEQDKPLDIHQVQTALEASLERQPLPYDKSGEEHYNIISAFIKSLRDSDPHAGLYYLARMLISGEDPLFIARRLVIFASEDIGNADPRALTIALAVKDAVEFVGLPEARINLAQGVTYLALAPKSNASYIAIMEAMEEVHRSGALPVPMHLRNATTQFMKNEGYGKGYRYAHDEADGAIKQIHLPSPLIGKKFYRPKSIGFEAQIKEKLERLEK